MFNYFVELTSGCIAIDSFKDHMIDMQFLGALHSLIHALQFNAVC